MFILCVQTLFAAESTFPCPIPLDDYPSANSLWENLLKRIEISPFNLFASIVFTCAIIHTFCHRYFVDIAECIHESDSTPDGSYFQTFGTDARRMFAKIFHLLGEVEITFALWLIPLFCGYIYTFGWNSLSSYIDHLTYISNKFEEPLFVMAIMLIAASKPIVQLASDIIERLANFGKGSVGAWWFIIMTVGPLLGSLITEPAAITICAMLLLQKFFIHSPSNKLKYATLGLLFVSISVGGLLTHFAAPPVLMVARNWEWTTPFMFTTFGVKSILVVFLSTLSYFIFFRREFTRLEVRRKKTASISHSIELRVPAWIVAFHVFFLMLTVLVMHSSVILMFTLMAFIAFSDVTSQFQDKTQYKSPILVGIFLTALVIHGDFQGWWIEPVLMSLSDSQLFLGGMLLTPFNDNAAITYLASLVPDFSDTMKYMIVSGAICGGGLTVIANAPNLAGVSILKDKFENGISPLKLFYAALFPTIVAASIFYFLYHI